MITDDSLTTYRSVFTRGTIVSMLLALLVATAIYAVGWTAFRAATIDTRTGRPPLGVCLLTIGVTLNLTLSAVQIVLITILRLLGHSARKRAGKDGRDL